MTKQINDKIQALYIAYADKLPVKIDSIVVKWTTLRNNYAQSELTHFHREVHTLCGSAGTYGYMGISLAARELENYLKELLNHDKLSNSEIQKINQLIEQLKTTTIKQADHNDVKAEPHTEHEEK